MARKKATGGGWDDLAVRPAGSGGLLQRHGTTVVLVAADGDAATLDAILSTCRDATDGRRLVRQLALILTDDDEPPAVVALAATGTGLATFVYGDAELAVTTGGKSETLSGRQSSAWVDRVFEWPLERLTAQVGRGSNDEPDERVDLTGGVVAASAVVLAPRPAGAPAPAPAKAPKPRAKAAVPTPPDEETVVASVDKAPPALEPIVTEEPAADAEPAPEFESVLLVQPDGEVAPPPPLDAADPIPDAEHGGAVVHGIMCKRQHFNAPSAAFCGVCGISMVQQTHQIVEGPRPPLGVIVFDDGTTFRIDDDYVIGREPQLDPDVANGRARGLVIVDDEGTVSRAHLRISLDEWDVRLIDRGSANGTYVAAPNTAVWSPLAPDEPMTIVPGTRVQVGRRTFVFDAHNRV
jgi:hypothetical protein